MPPTALLYKSLRKKRIKVNGLRVTDGSHRLAEGDFLEVYCNDEYFAAPAKELPLPVLPLSVVYEDDHILIMDKPHGLPSQGEGNTDSLEARMRAYLIKTGSYHPEAENTFLPSLCHRIDRNTDGLVIGAKDAESLRILNEKFRRREIRKFYLCETQKTPSPTEGEINGYLRRDDGARKMIFSSTEIPHATPCRTRYRVLQKGTPALVEAELLTGRTHQLRAGFAALGCPLLGDVKYGASPDGGNRYQHLTAYRLIFTFDGQDNGCLNHLQGKEFLLPRASKHRKEDLG